MRGTGWKNKRTGDLQEGEEANTGAVKEQGQRGEVELHAQAKMELVGEKSGKKELVWAGNSWMLCPALRQV